MAEEFGAAPVTDVDLLLQSLLSKYRIGQLVELSTLTCTDYDACVNVFSEIIQKASESTAGGTLSPVVVSNAERWFALIMSLASQSYFLTPMEKYELAQLMATEALLLFFYALENPTYISKLRALARIFYAGEPTKAAAMMICDLFRRPDDTPDSWFSRVQRIYHLLVRGAALATLIKYKPEALEVV